uniref:corrinoid adenosyltransferase n=1 Tax=Desulfobacca acetoxidans TaxID=60893 RepID=A0A7C5EM89_9BACT
MTRKRLKQGLVQVYTGDGKGKTTCALGLALRAVGQGFRAHIIQFLKTDDTGEVQAARRLAPDFTIESFGHPGFPRLTDPDPQTRERAAQAFQRARQVIMAGEHDLVILDEVNLALAYNLVPLQAMLELLKARPPQVEVVLTGRNAPPELVELADLVTEMRPVKHYFEAGVKARRGIEW